MHSVVVLTLLVCCWIVWLALVKLTATSVRKKSALGKLFQKGKGTFDFVDHTDRPKTDREKTDRQCSCSLLLPCFLISALTPTSTLALT
jgi:hypothetical protein